MISEILDEIQDLIDTSTLITDPEYIFIDNETSSKEFNTIYIDNNLISGRFTFRKKVEKQYYRYDPVEFECDKSIIIDFIKMNNIKKVPKSDCLFYASSTIYSASYIKNIDSNPPKRRGRPKKNIKPINLSPSYIHIEISMDSKYQDQLIKLIDDNEPVFK
jgi:hypothetical protein